MWFKNLRLYRLNKPFILSAEDFGGKLEQQAFQACPRMQASSFGWVSPLGRQGQLLVHAANGRMLICTRKEEKILPPSVIRELVAEQVADLEEERMRKVGRREKNNIRDEILQDLLPRALCRSVYTFAYVAPEDGFIAVDATSQVRAEELLGLLRKTLGSLSVVPLSVAHAPAAIMTRWLAQEQSMPAGFELGGECVLRDSGEDAGIVRCRNQDLRGQEIEAHIEAGKQAIRLSLHWSGVLSFILDEDMSIKRLRFSDIVEEQAAEVDADDELARFDSDFTIMSLELARFVPELTELFGGVEDVDHLGQADDQAAA